MLKINKKFKIGIVTGLFAVCTVAVAGSVVMNLPATANDNEFFTVVDGEAHANVNDVCSHVGEVYEEPTVNAGRFYLDGDVNKYCIEVSDNGTLKYDCDLSALIDEYVTFHQDKDAQKEKMINELSGNLSYKVETFHELGDRININVTNPSLDVHVMNLRYIDADTFAINDNLVFKRAEQ